MNSTPQTTTRRRYTWRWVLLGISLCLTPFVVLGIAAISYLTLDRDVRVLRHHVMAATNAGWATRTQVSVGGLTLGALSQGLRFVHHQDRDDARLALRSIKRASVGVYERTSGGKVVSREQFFAGTDRAMQKRGWVRMVGVVDGKDHVLVYVPKDMDDDGPVDICVAVVNGKELVVASATVDAKAIGELAARHSGDDLKNHLRLAKFKF